MDVLFFAYAHSSASPLPALQEEDDKVYSLLTPRALQQHYLIHRDAYTTRQKIREFLILYRDNIFLFSYSGHAGGQELLLADERSRAGGLAQLLGQCPNLKAVILNGCSTRGQVEQLLECGVPLVIATSTPVNDRSAKDFAASFFQSMSLGDTIERAFEIGIGAASLGAEITVHRSAALEDTGEPEEPIWGIYYKYRENLDIRLPDKPQQASAPEFTPNEKLIATLLDSLEGYSEDLEFLAYQEKKGKRVSASKKRMAILNCLPAPVAEHLRKLITPMSGSGDGYDQPGEARLKQLARTYSIITEMMAFILLAQLWEAKLEHGELVLPEKSMEVIHEFLHRARIEVDSYDYIELIRSIRQAFEEKANQGLVEFFVPELEEIKELPYKNDNFMAANFFLNTLRRRLNTGGIAAGEVPALCLRAEESLAEIFLHMGFMAEYTLASINDIDIEKYRHLRKPTFRHNIVRLIDLLGGLDQTDLVLERFTDNRSILLIKEPEEGGRLRELNLSPFIIDKHAFEEDARDTEVSNIYFFSHYDKQKDSYYFYRAYNPDEELLEAGNQQLMIVKAQLDAFFELLSPPGNEPERP
ncbi:MAG: hypothetical protein H6558_12845 [Lewinellaceae bacterium]|nr:hypothetical protein [Lewinellaceae bacterium]